MHRGGRVLERWQIGLVLLLFSTGQSKTQEIQGEPRAKDSKEHRFHLLMGKTTGIMQGDMDAGRVKIGNIPVSD